MAKNDEIAAADYGPVKRYRRVCKLLFWSAFLTSTGALFVQWASWGDLYKQLLSAASISFSIILIVVELYIRMHLFPCAELARRKHLVSDAMGQRLTYKTAENYYNNSAKKGIIPRLALNTMESAYFTGKLAEASLTKPRLLAVFYLLVILIMFFGPKLDPNISFVIAQTLVFEAVVVNLVQLEYLRFKCKGIQSQLDNLLGSSPNSLRGYAPAQMLVLFAEYEAVKANAAVMFSDKLFEKMNPKLSQNWNRIAARFDAEVRGKDT